MNSEPIHPAWGQAELRDTSSVLPARAFVHNGHMKRLQSTEFIFSPGQDPWGGGRSLTQGTLTLGEGSSMLSPCQPEMGTKGTVAGL